MDGPSTEIHDAEAAVQHSSLGGQLEAAGLPAWSVLAVALVEARHGEGSHEWREYAQALPSSTGCVLEWSEDEVGISEATSSTGPLCLEPLIVTSRTTE